VSKQTEYYLKINDIIKIIQITRAHILSLFNKLRANLFARNILAPRGDKRCLGNTNISTKASPQETFITCTGNQQIINNPAKTRIKYSSTPKVYLLHPEGPDGAKLQRQTE
jgi:hypothetical protein